MWRIVVLTCGMTSNTWRNFAAFFKNVCPERALGCPATLGSRLCLGQSVRMNAWATVGNTFELAGLGLSAYGLLRSWKVSSEGRRYFWPQWLRRLYFTMARLWGQMPAPVEIHLEDTVHLTGTGQLTATATVTKSGPTRC